MIKGPRTDPKQVWNGKRIADLRGAVVGKRKAKEIIAALNALLSWSVHATDKDVGEVQISDSNTSLLLPKGGASSSGSAGILWKGEWESDVSYAPNDMVLVSSTPGGLENDGNNYSGIWLCLTTNTGQRPIYPDPSPQYWQLISMAPRQVCVEVETVEKNMWVDGSDYYT